MALTVDQLRETFLTYFEGRGHLRIPSSSLVPHGDPTLLFTTAGMVQFKPYFMGLDEPPARRMTSVQKCFRTTDIEEVGDASHLTFFEMLGNFSVGDYFKAEAIEWAWDFLTGTLGIDPDRLWATVYIDDDEALELWAQRGVPRDRILRYTADQGNFWGPPGDSGPCGPCSELHFDFGATLGCRRCAEDTCHPDVGCGRFLEIWNLVFMAHFQDEDGTRTPLPAQNIDTGAGLERLAWVLQQGASVYDTNELRTVVDAVASIAGRAYDADESPEVARALRSMAEHARAIVFLVNDGVLPANEGRGYVLRRELRRALYFAHTIGLREPFLERAVDVALEVSSVHYPGLREQRDFIRRIAAAEEARFQATLARGLELLDDVLAREQASKRIPGRDMFVLYDTHGLPPELTCEVAAGLGFDVDETGFEAEMAAQRERSRGAQFGGDAEADRAQRYAALALESQFEGYETTMLDSEVTATIIDGARVDHLETGQQGEVVLAATSFYPEGGGQVGDRGEIVTATGRFRVDDTMRFGDVIVHAGAVLEGAIGANAAARAQVDRQWRLGSQRNHTATHLLHAALRSVLGTHVRQAGSYVGPDRLRFDYTHPEAPTAEELHAVQRLVNAKVRDDIRRETLELPYDAAIERGAIAFFEDRYTSTVRVVEYCELPDAEHPNDHGDGTHHHADHQHSAVCFSRELCGGTHLPSTGQVGILQVVSDSSIGAGLRRIEAVTGPEAERLIEERADLVNGLALRFRVPAAEVTGRIDLLEAQLAEERRRLEQQRREASAGAADRLLEAATVVGGVQVLGALVEADSSDDLRAMADRLRHQFGSAVVVLGADIAGRPALLVAVTDDVVARGVRADELVRAGAELIGGRGGGRPNLAQAGGRDASRLADAIEVARKLADARLRG
ncbi:MAG: alanine--tRNA ligase [Dehalococcoidia bacterium]|nr:alanine--tRNA ligase [Dehalococcoidia bacterium]